MTGSDFKNLRIRLGFTQKAIAQELGVSLSLVKKIEAGTRPVQNRYVRHLSRIPYALKRLRQSPKE